VRYSDGGEEELMWVELRHALQPPDEAAAEANVLRDADAMPAAALADEALLEQRASTLREAQRQAASAVPLSPQPPSEEGGAGAASPPHQPAPQPAMKKAVAYKGVSACGHRQFVATCQRNGRSFYLGRFSTAAAAARAYDDQMRAQDRREVNFPRRGEVQAVAHRRGTSHKTPGQRHPSRAAAASGAAAAAMPKKKVPQRTRTTQPSSAAAAPAKAPRVALKRRRAAAAAAGGTTAGVHALTPLVGRRVSLPFLGRRGSVKYFRGTVLAQKSDTHTYTVLFDDGDVRDDVTAAEILRRTIGDDGSDESSSSSESDSDADDGAAAPAGPERVHYVGVHCVQRADGTRFRAQLHERGVCIVVGMNFRSAEEAARARDVEARKRGMLHLLAFPATRAERAAVARHVATLQMVRVFARSGGVPPPSLLTRKRGAGHRGCAAPAPPPAKRTRAAATGGAGGAAAVAATRPPARSRRTAAAPVAASPAPVASSSGEQLPSTPRAPSAAAARDDGDANGGAAPAAAAAAAAPDATPAVAPAAAPPAAAPDAAPAAAPVAATPAAAPGAAGGGGQAAQAHSDDDADTARMLSFLRGITPPLSNLPAVLAAARSNRIPLAHLAMVPSYGQFALDVAAHSLQIASRDKLLFAMALTKLSQSRVGDGDAMAL
jgi:hypothetical protein